MRFGPIGVDEAAGAILAHALKVDDLRFRKGRLLTLEDVARLKAARIADVIAARLEPGDVQEDEAAAALGRALVKAGVTVSPAATGRVNIFAASAGVFRADRAAIDRLNRIDPAITFACLNDFAPVAAGAMVATIKIIPLAVSGAALARAVEAIAAEGLIAVHAFRAMKVGLVATELPSLKPSVMDKTAALLSERLKPSSSVLTAERRVAHDEGAVADAIRGLASDNDLIVLFGASAVTDPADVLPAAIRRAGGTVEQVGMPVDPGNLLVLGTVHGRPVIGAPGCARSPKENGFDWVLNRILAGMIPTRDDITGMGVGGLLMEIPTRPQPRAATQAEAAAPAPLTIDTVLLAAGRASRMGEGYGHKLLATFDGIPLVRRTAETALAAGLGRVIAVTGYRAGDVEAALEGLGIVLCANPDYASGMASSLATGVAAVSPEAGGVLVLLADMPAIAPDHLIRLAEAFREADGQAIVRAAYGGQRGNPVILPRSAFASVAALTGDMGARPIVESGSFDVVDVEIGAAAHLDVDTPEAVRAAGGVLER